MELTLGGELAQIDENPAALRVYGAAEFNSVNNLDHVRS